MGGLKRESRPYGVACLVPFAHGTPTIMRWSFDMRSWGLTQATLSMKETEQA
jgi:hypothetical protein